MDGIHSHLPLSGSSRDSNVPTPGSPAVYAGFKNRFSVIAGQHQQTGLTALINRIILWLRDSNFLTFASNMGVEHMGMKLSGNLFTEALTRTQDILNKINTPSAARMSSLLEDTHKIEKIIDKDPKTAVRTAKRKVESLEVGEKTGVPINFEEHQMIMIVTRTPDVGGKKQFSFELHNTGEGLQYHYSKIVNGKEVFQTGMRINHIPGENLYGPSATFFDKILLTSDQSNNTTVKTFYEDYLPLTEGVLEPPDPNPDRWNPPQLGTSCTSSCLRSAMNYQFSSEDYNQFNEFATHELLYKTISQIWSGASKSTDQKMIAMELLNKIQHFHQAQGQALPPELKQIKERLESMMPVKTTPKPMVQTENMIDNLNYAFSTLSEEGFSEAAINKAESYLAKAESALAKMKTNTKIDHITIKKFVELSKAIENYYKDRPLNYQSIYFLTGISTSLVKMTAFLHENNSFVKTKGFSRAADENNKFFVYMHERYNALSLNSGTKTPFQTLIDQGQTQIYADREDEPTPELLLMQSKLSNKSL